MFNWVYTFVTNSKSFSDPLMVYKTYFIKEGAFDTACWTALGIALSLCVIYYLLTRKSMSLAKRPVWAVVLLLAAALSFGSSAYYAGLDSRTSGLGHTLEVQARKLQPNNPEQTAKDKQKLRQSFNKGVFRCSPVNTFCWTSFVVGGVMFFVFSIGCKRFGGYGRNIPF